MSQSMEARARIAAARSRRTLRGCNTMLNRRNHCLKMGEKRVSDCVGGPVQQGVRVAIHAIVDSTGKRKTLQPMTRAE